MKKNLKKIIRNYYELKSIKLNKNIFKRTNKFFENASEKNINEGKKIIKTLIDSASEFVTILETKVKFSTISEYSVDELIEINRGIEFDFLRPYEKIKKNYIDLIDLAEYMTLEHTNTTLPNKKQSLGFSNNDIDNALDQFNEKPKKHEQTQNNTIYSNPGIETKRYIASNLIEVLKSIVEELDKKFMKFSKELNPLKMLLESNDLSNGKTPLTSNIINYIDQIKKYSEKLKFFYQKNNLDICFGILYGITKTGKIVDFTTEEYSPSGKKDLEAKNDYCIQMNIFNVIACIKSIIQNLESIYN